jgi:glutamate formiminotransferase
MRLLTVPNWSFGRNRDLRRRFEDILTRPDLRVHYMLGDADHNRTVTAFSGEHGPLREALLGLAETAFGSIDLSSHSGVHPRIGALDVCPVVLPPGSTDLAGAISFTEDLAQELAERFDLPIYLYEKSERGRHEADLPALRRGGFGSLLTRDLEPDFGPRKAHPRLGVTVMGVRDFLIAINANLATKDISLAKLIAKEIRMLRSEGDSRFLGVRALGFLLASKSQVQVSMNITLPDLTPVDPILDWVRTRSRKDGVSVAECELIGVIRRRDLGQASWLRVDPRQIVEDDE